jgi:hypothetical protein
MTLSPGTRHGPYEIQAAIGAGCMGEVYRTTDARLGRGPPGGQCNQCSTSLPSGRDGEAADTDYPHVGLRGPVRHKQDSQGLPGSS